jgi:hypothetical protein
MEERMTSKEKCDSPWVDPTRIIAGLAAAA